MDNKPIGVLELSDSSLTIVRSPKRIRAVIGNVTVADSRHVLLLRGDSIKPTYLFPASSLAPNFLTRSNSTGKHRSGLKVAYWDVGLERRATDGVWNPVTDHTFEGEPLSAFIGLEWTSVDSWFEEDEQFFGHARDPNVRVDALQSSAHVKVVLRNQLVAETRRPVLLFHTGLVTRFYLPKEDILPGLLVPSPTTARCPYVGLASYWSAKFSEAEPIPDIGWEYREPSHAVEKIRGLIAFDRGLVDQIRLDGIPVVL